MIERYLTGLLRTILNSPFKGIFVSTNRLFYPIEIPNWVETTYLDLSLPGLSPEFDGYRVVQFGDFHLGTWLNSEKLLEVINLVNNYEPDLITITGDFVTLDPKKFAPDLISALSRLCSQDGVVAILGNHDHWTNPDIIRSVLHDSGIHDLSNDVYTINRAESSLHICGVDDVMERQDRLDIVQSKLPEDGVAVLIAHEPDFADISAKTGRFCLQLSGHSHGGQMLINGSKPLYLPKYARKYPSGLYQIGNMFLYTNRGLGTAEIQIRRNCKPEITVITLSSQPTPESP